MILFILRKFILQTYMFSHPMGLDVWFLVEPFVCFHTSCDCVNSEGSGETAQMRRLAWAFAGRLCDKYHNLMSWLKCFWTREISHTTYTHLLQNFNKNSDHTNNDILKCCWYYKHLLSKMKFPHSVTCLTSIFCPTVNHGCSRTQGKYQWNLMLPTDLKQCKLKNGFKGLCFSKIALSWSGLRIFIHLSDRPFFSAKTGCLEQKH